MSPYTKPKACVYVHGSPVTTISIIRHPYERPKDKESYFTYGAEEESQVDHDIHFRPGTAADGTETFTPRAILYDLKGAFGTLRRENALYSGQDDPTSIAQQMWSGSTNVIAHNPIPPSTYQQHLDQGLEPPALTPETVRFWSDYNRIFYHPRSIVQLNEFELNSSLMPFERWSTGEELFSNLDKEHDLLDRDLRPFLEECDQLQGIQIITSAGDAWGGFTARYLERMRDELGKTSAWVWGLEDGGRKTREQRLLQTANVAQSLYQIPEQASMYVPLTSLPASLPSYVNLDAASLWHTSALQAIALESITLPTRLRSGRISFDELETVLSNDGNRKIATIDFSVENPGHLDASLEIPEQHDTRMNGHGHTNGITHDEDGELPRLDISMQPAVESTSFNRQSTTTSRKDHIFSQVQSLRGNWKSSLEIEDMNLASRDRFGHGPRILSNQSALLFPVLDSYPSIFTCAGPMGKIAVQTTLSASSAVALRVRSVERVARSIVGIDEREALCDGLVSMCEEYEEGWESGSDDDDDL